MTAVVRVLLASPITVLVAWLASVGVNVSSDLVITVITPAVGAVATGAVHLAARRWQWFGRAVAWLARERDELVPDK